MRIKMNQDKFSYSTFNFHLLLGLGLESCFGIHHSKVLEAEVIVVPDVGCGVFGNDPFVIGGCKGPRPVGKDFGTRDWWICFWGILSTSCTLHDINYPEDPKKKKERKTMENPSVSPRTGSKTFNFWFLEALAVCCGAMHQVWPRWSRWSSRVVGTTLPMPARKLSRARTAGFSTQDQGFEYLWGFQLICFNMFQYVSICFKFQSRSCQPIPGSQAKVPGGLCMFKSGAKGISRPKPTIEIGETWWNTVLNVRYCIWVIIVSM